MAGGIDLAQADAGWAALATLPRPTLATLFGAADRLERYSTDLALPGGTIRFDWSKTHLDASVETALTGIAAAMQVDAARAALFAGAVVNPSEGRAAEHPAQLYWLLMPDAAMRTAFIAHLRAQGAGSRRRLRALGTECGLAGHMRGCSHGGQ